MKLQKSLKKPRTVAVRGFGCVLRQITLQQPPRWQWWARRHLRGELPGHFGGWRPRPSHPLRLGPVQWQFSRRGLTRTVQASQVGFWILLLWLMPQFNAWDWCAINLYLSSFSAAIFLVWIFFFFFLVRQPFKRKLILNGLMVFLLLLVFLVWTDFSFSLKSLYLLWWFFSLLSQWHK